MRLLSNTLRSRLHRPKFLLEPVACQFITQVLVEGMCVFALNVARDLDERAASPLQFLLRRFYERAPDAAATAVAGHYQSRQPAN